MQGRWWWWEMHQNNKNDHLQLMFKCERGGNGGECVETMKKPPQAHVWM